MNVDGNPYRTIWLAADADAVNIIDQRWLPHRFEVVQLRRYQDGVEAIADMLVRGAPLIGATAAWSLYLAALEADRDNLGPSHLAQAAAELRAARPTAVNLAWAIDRMLASVADCQDLEQQVARLRTAAETLCEEDVQTNRSIGEHGLALIRRQQDQRHGEPVNILTHCNAGWLATVDWGTATAPIYLAHQEGIPVHVWVDETRPRNQGAQLTAWELAQAGIAHTVIVDNAGGHLMQHGLVDMCIVGTDRVTCTGDVCNKIGTYLKALAAFDNDIPFYVALPSSTIDWTLSDGLREVPIEERDSTEVSEVYGQTAGGKTQRVRITPAASDCANPAFDVTPARLVSALITERGVVDASEQALRARFKRVH
ncbi:MAG: S-methyl-5-thioribose-1-phosphate isomerase [Pseudomonadota bacterium]